MIITVQIPQLTETGDEMVTPIEITGTEIDGDVKLTAGDGPIYANAAELIEALSRFTR